MSACGGMEINDITDYRVPVIFNTKSNPPFNSSVVKYPVCCSWSKLKMYFEGIKENLVNVMSFCCRYESSQCNSRVRS